MKNFVKLIQQVHTERGSIVLDKILKEKVPVAFVSVEPIAQAVETVKIFLNQGLNITNLITTDTPPNQFGFNIIHVSNAAQIFPKPEYVFAQDGITAKLARKFMSNSKIIVNSAIRGKSTEEVYEIFMAHLDDLQEVYESLVDEESRKTFRGFWLGCITNQISSVVYANTPQYICHGFLPKEGSIFFDCGAYDGATSAHFVDMGCRVYGFEMSKTNYERAAKLAAEKNFVVENIGLGALRDTINYVQNGAATRIATNGSETAQITTIDNYVGEKNLPRVDFIKMDVEGAEANILKGAATTIARFKPILALSAYHRLDDFWTLTKLIKSIRPDYEFALRQYATTPEDIADFFSKDLINFLKAFDLEVDMPNYEECVLFAR